MEQVAAIWLAAQRRRLAGLAHALLLAADADGRPLAPLASLPVGDEVPAALATASRLALRERRAVLRAGQGSPDDEGRARDVIACPLLVGGRLLAAVAVELPSAPIAEQQRAAQTLHEGCAWFEVLLRAEAAALGGRLASVLEVLAAVLEQDGPQAAATVLVTELANRLDAERASLGLARGGEVRLLAMSHSARLERRGSLAAGIGECMREALAHGDGVLWNADEDADTLAPAHAALAARDGARAILSVPLPDAAGAVTVERMSARPFVARERETVEAVLTLAAPVLALKRELARSALLRAGDAAVTGGGRLLGAGHLVTKLVALALLAGAALLALPADFNVAAPAALEGSVQRVVTAARDGFVANASVRAGDVVRAGQEMARLDVRDIELELRKWQGRAAQLGKEHRDALASHDRPQVSILTAQIEQAHAEMALLEAQLSRSRLLAPIDGVVLSGDLSQALGAPVSRGEVLFEVAPLDGYRVVLEVDERDVGHLAAGQTGRVALAARPDRPLELVVQRVTPVAETEQGVHHFRVEAALATPDEGLRPGMEGVAKVLAGRRPLGWILEPTAGGLAAARGMAVAAVSMPAATRAPTAGRG